MLPSGQESEELRYLPHSAFRRCDFFCVFCFGGEDRKTPRYLEMWLHCLIDLCVVTGTERGGK